MGPVTERSVNSWTWRGAGLGLLWVLFRVQGLGFRVLGLRVLGLRVLGFRALGLGL